MLLTRKQFFQFSFLLFLFSLLVWYREPVYSAVGIGQQVTPEAYHNLDSSVALDAANSTLGFSAVLAVSPADSSRRARLIQAANVTEIDLIIPDQPKWTEEDVEKFNEALVQSNHKETGRGSILAWLSHIHVLQWFLDSGLETALILEDDVDWDIHLRTVQIPGAAAAIRSLLPAGSEYYGNVSAWDLLWIGHCGDWFNKIEAGIGPGFQSPSTLASVSHRTYEDYTLPDRESLHPFTRDLMDALELPEKMRAVHQAVHPLCTFGYAVNRASAARIVADIAPINQPGTGAYDLAMLHGCAKLGLRCYTVNPELFHHTVGDSIIAQEEQREVIYLPPVDAKGLEQTKERNETSNIDCGFWSGDFEFNTPERLQLLRAEVGRKGRCLKPGRQ